MSESSQEVTAYAAAAADLEPSSRAGRAGELANGETVGRYLVVGRLGAGGMGIVYAAYDPELDRKLAIKLLRTGARSSSAEARTRLLREAQAMARLSHPNVVNVHDVGTHHGRVYVAMEFIAGGTLKDWLMVRRPQAEVLACFRQAGAGLAAAHAAGIIHRDFKPDNVLLTESGINKVTDFGLARASRPAQSTELTGDDDVSNEGRSPADLLSTELTAYGSVMGTPAYMSPEQFNQGETDARSDQFSFCVALWEGLSGTRPFVAEGIPALALAVTTGRVTESVRSHRLPRWLRSILLRGLRSRPADRFGSMNELLAALARDPAPRRRIFFAVASVAALAAAIFAYSHLQVEQSKQRCLLRSGEIERAWSDQPRAQVEASLRAIPGVYVEQTWTRVNDGLSLWTEEWRDVTTRTCLEATVDKTRTLSVYDSNLRCLDDQRRNLSSLVEVLAAGGPQVARRAALAVSRLPRPSDCLEEQVLRGYAEVEDPARSGDIGQTREFLAQAANLVAMGRYPDANEPAREALESALRSGHISLQADAHVQVGELASATGDYATARRELVEALTLGGSVGRDQLEAELALRLARLEGVKMGHHEAAQVWAEIARTRLFALGELETLRGASLHAVLGGLHFANGEYEQALLAHERALAIRLRELGEGHPLVAEAQADMGLALREQGEYRRAIETMTAAVASYEAALGSEHPALGGVRNNLGNALFAAERRDEARAQYQRSLEIHERALGPNHPDVASSVGSLGLVQLGDRDWAGAISSFQRVLSIYEGALGSDHPGVAVVMDNLGQAQLGAGDSAAAIASFTRGLAIRRVKLAVDHPDIAKSLAQLGDAQLEAGDFVSARTSYLESLELALAHQGDSHRGLTAPLLGLAQIEVKQPSERLSAVARVNRALTIAVDQREPRILEIAALTLRAAQVLEQIPRHNLDDIRARLVAIRSKLGAEASASGVAADIDLWLSHHPASGALPK